MDSVLLVVHVMLIGQEVEHHVNVTEPAESLVTCFPAVYQSLFHFGM